MSDNALKSVKVIHNAILLLDLCTNHNPSSLSN